MEVFVVGAALMTLLLLFWVWFFWDSPITVFVLYALGISKSRYVKPGEFDECYCTDCGHLLLVRFDKKYDPITGKVKSARRYLSCPRGCISWNRVGGVEVPPAKAR